MEAQYKSYWLLNTPAERRDKEKKLTFVTLFSEKHVDRNIKGRRVRKESFENLCKKKKMERQCQISLQFMSIVKV